MTAFEIAQYRGDQLCFQLPVLVSEYKVLLASGSQPPSSPATTANRGEFRRLESKIRASRILT